MHGSQLPVIRIKEPARSKQIYPFFMAYDCMCSNTMKIFQHSEAFYQYLHISNIMFSSTQADVSQRSIFFITNILSVQNSVPNEGFMF